MKQLYSVYIWRERGMYVPIIWGIPLKNAQNIAKKLRNLKRTVITLPTWTQKN